MQDNLLNEEGSDKLQSVRPLVEFERIDTFVQRVQRSNHQIVHPETCYEKYRLSRKNAMKLQVI